MSLPHYSVTDFDSERTAAEVHGSILAAGTSSRFGEGNKLLATVDGEPIVRQAARTLLESDTDGVTVVVGHEGARVRAAIEEMPVSVRENPVYEQGQSTTVAEAVQAARDRDADAVVIALGDMPFVSPESIDALVEAYERGIGDAIALAYEGTRGNPVLFDARFFDALLDVSGDIGGREILLSTDRGALLNVADPGVCRDIDQPEEIPESTGETDR